MPYFSYQLENLFFSINYIKFSYQVHRRLLKDDAFGVGEALNETAFGTGLISRGKHWVVFGKKGLPSPNLEAQERFLQNEVLIPAWLFFSNASGMSFDDWANKFNNEVSVNFAQELSKSTKNFGLKIFRYLEKDFWPLLLI